MCGLFLRENVLIKLSLKDSDYSILFMNTEFLSYDCSLMLLHLLQPSFPNCSKGNSNDFYYIPSLAILSIAVAIHIFVCPEKK